MIKSRVKIVNKLGLHTRAVGLFVEMASRFRCEVRVGTGEQMVDGKNVMQIMLLAAGHGTSLHLHAEGDDAREAMSALCALVKDGFGEDEKEHGKHS